MSAVYDKKAKRNCLDTKQKFRLGSWMLSNVENLNGNPASVAARRATEDLGFPVSESNLALAQRFSGVKIKLTKPRVGAKRPGDKHKRDRTQFVAFSLCRLMEKMGEDPGARLRAIALRNKINNPLAA